MTEDTEFEVYFEEYCKTCKYVAVKHYEEPCNECLDHPININSHKPVMWKER